MEKLLTETDLEKQLLEPARALYQRLSEELHAALDLLKKGEPVPDAEAKGRAETIRAHRKALQTVLDIEAQFLRARNDANKLRAIDVDAAKREIYRRLDRVAAARSPKGAD